MTSKIRHAGLSEDLPIHAQQSVAVTAERLGFDGLWTPENRMRDGFVTCTAWGLATTSITLGIGVAPAPMRTAHALAMAALSVQDATDGRFILGIGSGSRAGSIAHFGHDPGPPISNMSDYLTVIPALMAGETVTYQGKTMKIASDAVQLTPRPEPAPLYLAALGTQMMALAGRKADGVLLNWTNRERIELARAIVGENAAKSGRNAADIVIAGYVRVCVDEDEDLARHAVATQTVRYLLIPSYRAQFEEMGFVGVSDEVRAALDSGGIDAAAGRVPVELVDRVCAYGPPAKARAMFERNSEGLDLPIVRIVPAHTTIESIVAVLEATHPL